MPRNFRHIDAVTALSELVDVNLVFIDPPWNTGKKQKSDVAEYDDSFSDQSIRLFAGDICKGAMGAIGLDGWFAVWVDYRTAYVWVSEAIAAGFSHRGEVIVESGLGRPSMSEWPMKHSNILLFSVGNPDFDIEALPMVERRAAKDGYQGDKRAASVLWSGFSNTDGRRTGYPTEKNPSICEIVVKALCPENGEYADCFCGSGSSAAFDIGAREAHLSDVSYASYCVASSRVVSDNPKTEARKPRESKSKVTFVL